MQQILGAFKRNGAEFSPCRTWRYTLTRAWSFGDSMATKCAIIGLNPSTADEEADDPTIRRCMTFAARLGMESMVMLNLFGYRATIPDDMLAFPAPIGSGNDAAIMETIAQCGGPIIAAWGDDKEPIVRSRAEAVYAMITAAGRELHCLGTTKHGAPRHPLFVKADKAIELFTLAADRRRLAKSSAKEAAKEVAKERQGDGE